MKTLLGRFAFGPAKRRVRQENAREKQSPIKTTTFFAQIDRRLIVRCLSVFGEVMTRYAYPPLFQLVSIDGKVGVCNICLVLIYSLAVYSCQVAMLVA
jgi:hypothetical protein